QPSKRMTKQLIAFAFRRAMPVHLPRAEQCIGLALTVHLELARPLHASPDRVGRLACGRSHELGFPRRRYFKLNVNTIRERARDAAAITCDSLWRAAAAAVAVSAMAARTWIHRGEQLKARGKLGLPGGPCNRDPARLQGLAQRFEHV